MYIVDYYDEKSKTVIELNGYSHYMNFGECLTLRSLNRLKNIEMMGHKIKIIRLFES